MAARVRCFDVVPNGACTLLVAGTLNALETLRYSEITAFQGGAFGVITTLVSLATKPIFIKIFARQGAHDVTRTVGFVLHLGVEIAVSLGIWMALGYSISLIPIPLLIFNQAINFFVMVLYFGMKIF